MMNDITDQNHLILYTCILRALLKIVHLQLCISNHIQYTQCSQYCVIVYTFIHMYSMHTVIVLLQLLNLGFILAMYLLVPSYKKISIFIICIPVSYIADFVIIHSIHYQYIKLHAYRSLLFINGDGCCVFSLIQIHQHCSFRSQIISLIWYIISVSCRRDIVVKGTISVILQTSEQRLQCVQQLIECQLFFISD